MSLLENIVHTFIATDWALFIFSVLHAHLIMCLRHVHLRSNMSLCTLHNTFLFLLQRKVTNYHKVLNKSAFRCPGGFLTHG